MHLIFEESNFAGYTGSKNQVQKSSSYQLGKSLVAPKWKFEFRNDSNPFRPDCGCYSKQNWGLFYERSEHCLFYKSSW